MSGQQCDLHPILGEGHSGAAETVDFARLMQTVQIVGGIWSLCPSPRLTTQLRGKQRREFPVDWCGFSASFRQGCGGFCGLRAS
eukprot:2565261-Alexandrium_andersonii.AAC.1